jgi:hypothetical protein
VGEIRSDAFLCAAPSLSLLLLLLLLLALRDRPTSLQVPPRSSSSEGCFLDPLSLLLGASLWVLRRAETDTGREVRLSEWRPKGSDSGRARGISGLVVAVELRKPDVEKGGFTGVTGAL